MDMDVHRGPVELMEGICAGWSWWGWVFRAVTLKVFRRSSAKQGEETRPWQQIDSLQETGTKY